MTRRTTELLLLVAAAPTLLLLFAMLSIYQNQTLDASIVVVPVCLFAAFVVAHLAVRKLAPGADPAILPIAFMLVGIGIAFITRIDPDLAFKQVIWLALSIIAFILVLAFVRSVDNLAEYWILLAIVGFILLLLPMLPVVGREISGARLWIGIGDFTFQPGEVAKIAIILFLGGYLASNRELLSVFTWHVGPLRLPDIRTLLPLLIMWAIAVLIVVFEKDLGSALVFFFVFIAMLYFASGKKFYLVISLLLASVAAVILYMTFAHVQVRVQTWLDPFADAQGTGYQLCQSLYSLADGGLIGTGIGAGLAGSSSMGIPVVESDFIFSCIAEETGLLGAGGVILLYLLFAVRGFTTASRARTDVSSLVAAGLTTSVALQAFIIVGGVTKLIPLTGLTLPLVSQGGSSMLATFIGIALLMRCGDEGTDLETEMQLTTRMAHGANSELGRYSLGKRLTGGIVTFSILFAVLIGNLTWTMIVQQDYYQNMPGNNHAIYNSQKIQRGTISTADGVILAQSVKGDENPGADVTISAVESYTRVYPQGTMAAQVVGYFSNVYGSSGIEASYNEELTGQKSFATWRDAFAAITGTGTAGNDVILTIDSSVQQAAQDALAGYNGACIVIQPSTGAILAMASSPTYNPGNLQEAMSGDPDVSVYNRATDALYAPGSTFKIVTLTAALEAGIKEEDTYSSPGTMDIGNAAVSNFDEISYGTISLERATEVSSNTVFGQVGVELGAKKLVQAANDFGFGLDFVFDLPLTASLMADPDEMTVWETAWAAAGEPVAVNFGNRESPAGPQATVLQMALVGCAVANNGVIMKPYLVSSIFNANGALSSSTKPEQLCVAMDAGTASRVTTVLEGVVNNGTGYPARIDGVQVAGKTGTAELDDGNNYWFVGFAPSGDSDVVIAIVIEKGESGIAAERAKPVLEAALAVTGSL